VAAGNTLTALAGRFNKETDTKILKAVPLQNTGAGNGSASITLMSKVPV
jgi:hypothetical protein